MREENRWRNGVEQQQREIAAGPGTVANQDGSRSNDCSVWCVHRREREERSLYVAKN